MQGDCCSLQRRNCLEWKSMCIVRGKSETTVRVFVTVDVGFHDSVRAIVVTTVSPDTKHHS